MDAVSPLLIVILALLVVGFLWFSIEKVVEAHRSQVTTGREELIGKRALVKTALDPQGMVLFKGELWAAVSESGPVEVGKEVTIKRVEDLIVYVVN
jgi:membrane-bound ClpP family serine protease